jgi:hypothetical protein
MFFVSEKEIGLAVKSIAHSDCQFWQFIVTG